MLIIAAWISIGLAFACAIWITFDEIRHPQAMSVMNVVWPISALYFSVVALWAYYRVDKAKTKAAMGQKNLQGGDRKSNHKNAEPSVWNVAVGTSHCGAGCMTADVICEFAIAATGITLFGSVLWAEYAIDFIAAWAVGIIFQYFSIKPMRDVSMGEAVIAAVKADTLSIAAFQIGMYAWMALTYFVLFPEPHLTPFDPRYWLLMQCAMICGYFTSYPVNRWLIRSGLKGAM